MQGSTFALWVTVPKDFGRNRHSLSRFHKSIKLGRISKHVFILYIGSNGWVWLIAEHTRPPRGDSDIYKSLSWSFVTSLKRCNPFASSSPRFRDGYTTTITTTISTCWYLRFPAVTRIYSRGWNFSHLLVLRQLEYNLGKAGKNMGKRVCFLYISRSCLF